MSHQRRCVLAFLGPTAVWQRLRLWRRIVCTVQSIDFVPGDRFRSLWLQFVQQLPQAFIFEPSLFEDVVDATEPTPKQR